MAWPTHRVFLSHSGKDKEFVRELYRRLTRDGVSCFFDVESIGWGANWVRALERAVDECEYIVFVLSPDFCNSEWVEVERTSAIADDPAGLKRKVRLLMLRDCGELPTFPRFLKQVQAMDVSTAPLFEANYPRICQELGGIPRDEQAFVDRTKLPPAHPLPQRHCMPFASLGEKFIGRVDDIWNLYDSLFRNSTTVLQGTGVVAGTGGLGKSQLAIEYAHRFGSAYPGGVYWVTADRGFGPLITDIGRAAGIEVDKKAEEPVQVEQIWHGLHGLGTPCLAILDNFPEDELLQRYLPPTGRIHTIVTTRRRDIQKATVRLGALSREEGAQLLNSGERRFGDSAAALSERLGGLPLALELAKSYLNRRVDLKLDDLLRDMDESGEMEVLSDFAEEYRDQLPSGHELDVVRTFQMSWQIAPDQCKEILRVMGELAPAPVPCWFLRKVLGIAEWSGRRDELGKSLAELARLSLVELDTAGNPVAHRLILAFLRHRNAVDNVSPFNACVETVKQLMEKAFQNPDGRVMRQSEELVPHAEFLLTRDRLATLEFGLLTNGLGRHHQNMGRFISAKDALSASLASYERQFKPGHSFIAITQSNVAVVLQDLGKLDEARDLLRQALASHERQYEPGHPSIARSQSNLALVLKDLGKLDEARDLLRQALASHERQYEPGHPSIARSQSNLALVLKDLGQLDEARDLLRQALASDERQYEPGHPSIARSQSNLALVLQDLGQLDEARDLLRQALASDERQYEPGHPSIARSQSNLALVLQDLGQLDEARDLFRQALASDERQYEPGHPSIARSQSNLALVLKDLGQLDEARDLLRKALASDERQFEPGHPSIAIRQSNLALVLQDLVQLDEARDLLRKALASDERQYEPGHPSIARSQSNLAMVLKGLGQLDEARDLLRKALASDERQYEPGHPSIARSQSNLALVLEDLGQLDEARDLLGKAYTASLERYGPDHPPTKVLKNNLDGLPAE